MQILWFKRDLRIHDHDALISAIKAQTVHGAILPIYIYEPELWQQPDMSPRHYCFLYESLASLHQQLATIGCPLIVKVGNAVQILQALHDKYQISALWSHQETWNNWTYQRDIAVSRWTKKHNIIWYEPLQYGIFRRIDRLNGRDSWATLWHDKILADTAPSPSSLQCINEPSDTLPTPICLAKKVYRLHTEISKPLSFIFNNNSYNLNIENRSSVLVYDNCPFRQLGGRENAIAVLQSFFNYRGEQYTKRMSSPLTAFESCSRLSAYIAFGVLSLREIFHTYIQKHQYLQSLPKYLQGSWTRSMSSFSSRLRWHCHFMQKLEDEPDIEFKNLHPIYDGLREPEFNESYFTAWKTGRTGYPMIDACMRALIATGWINFRMRAMLVSFASYHLWLHWQKTAIYLAGLFVDYEPGIHYSQMQMQSGTTGINSIRVYNPIKQSQDQDPNGVFIRRWLPKLREMPTEFIHNPWKCSNMMNGYPMPIVDEKQARRAATDKLYSVRKTLGHSSIAKKVLKTHASRKNNKKKKKVVKQKSVTNQLSLDL